MKHACEIEGWLDYRKPKLGEGIEHILGDLGRCHENVLDTLVQTTGAQRWPNGKIPLDNKGENAAGEKVPIDTFAAERKGLCSRPHFVDIAFRTGVEIGSEKLGISPGNEFFEQELVPFDEETTL
jgi:hypothetical protein